MHLFKSFRTTVIGLAVVALISAAVVPSPANADPRLEVDPLTVTFKSGSSSLDSTAKRTLNSFRNKVAGNLYLVMNGFNVTVTGHIRNHSLQPDGIALARANAVKEFLSARDIFGGNTVGGGNKIIAKDGGVPSRGGSIPSANKAVITIGPLIGYQFYVKMTSDSTRTALSEASCGRLLAKAYLRSYEDDSSFTDTKSGEWDSVEKTCTLRVGVFESLSGTYYGQVTITDRAKFNRLRYFKVAKQQTDGLKWYNFNRVLYDNNSLMISPTFRLRPLPFEEGESLNHTLQVALVGQ